MVVWRSVTPRVTRITRSAHHARAHARHYRSLPPRAHACLRCSGSGARSLPRLRARGVAGNAILVAFRCRSPPSHPTHPPRQFPPNRPVPYRQVRRCSGKAHSRARIAAAVALDRSIARARCGGGGGGGGRLHRAPRVSHTSRASLVTRAHAHIITRASSRASSLFSAPPAHNRHARAAAAAALARSLDHSIARTRCGVGRRRWRWRWRSVTPRITRITRARVRHHGASRASSPPPSPMSTMRARGVRSLAHLLLRTSPRRTPNVRA